MELLKRLKLLWILKQKYGITTKLHSKVGRASYKFSGVNDNSSWTFDQQTILICLWDKDFYEYLFHEVGHLLDAKHTKGYTSGRYNQVYTLTCTYGNVSIIPFTESDYIEEYISNSNNGSYAKLLVKEAVASRYALRALRSLRLQKKNSKEVLSYYLGSYCQFMSNLTIADNTYKLMKLL